MAFFVDNQGGIHQVEIGPEVHKAALDAGMSVKTYLNRKYANADTKLGSAFAQLCASEGLALVPQNQFGIRAATMSEILDGKIGMQAAGVANTADRGSPFGTSARSLAPVAIIEMVEDMVARDRVTDEVTFREMVAQNISIDGENFIQPVVSYNTVGGPEQAKAQRVSEFAEPGTMLRLGTSERIRSLPAFSMGIEVSDKAQRALTIDVVASSIARYVEVERDQRVYGYLSALFSGDNDLVVGAIPTVTSVSLDSASTGGVLTHRAWVKWLARNRKKRVITHAVMDIDTYLKVEGRTGRPGTNSYDPSLARIDPQAVAANMAQLGWGNNVKFMIVDPATEGGPVPANTIWGLDANKAATLVTNSQAAYSASEAFALRRSSAMRWDWSEAVYRSYGDSDVTPFDVLTITP